jgi:hypothetical protein
VTVVRDIACLAKRKVLESQVFGNQCLEIRGSKNEVKRWLRGSASVRRYSQNYRIGRAVCNTYSMACPGLLTCGWTKPEVDFKMAR